jgi:hypothetical protein
VYSLEVAGGHSIAGVKGTDFIMEVDDNGVDTYTVKEGVVEVTSINDPSNKIELKDGDSVKVTAAGIEDNPYNWDALIEKYGLENLDISEPIETANIGGQIGDREETSKDVVTEKSAALESGKLPLDKIIIAIFGVIILALVYIKIRKK